MARNEKLKLWLFGGTVIIFLVLDWLLPHVASALGNIFFLLFVAYLIFGVLYLGYMAIRHRNS